MKNLLFLILIFVLTFNLTAQSKVSTNDLSNEWYKKSLNIKELPIKIRYLKRALILDQNNYMAVQELGLSYIKLGKEKIGQKYLSSASELYKNMKKPLHTSENIILPKNFGIEKIGLITLSP